MNAFEVNFDGLPGPTHNYAGLAPGNLAATSHAFEPSNPKKAALQGLGKMKALAAMGLKQAVLPPHARPDIGALRRLGFAGADAEVLAAAWRAEPRIVHAVYSAASMWTANAATISPSADSSDGRVHFTPANLVTNFHRSLEPDTTARVLRAIFSDPSCFAHHDPLPPVDLFGDEGAANHTRLCTDYGQPGLELFVYGRQAFGGSSAAPTKFPARQTREASQAIARLHGLDLSNTVFARQCPQVIDAGVFHNDVIAVGNLNTMFFHEHAFADKERVLDELAAKFEPATLELIEVPDSRVRVADAVSSYLFNSQLLRPRAGEPMVLVVPMETQENPKVKAYLDWLAASNHPVGKVLAFDLRQSMRNGGGPACLRLRVVLNEHELERANPAVFLTDELFDTLTAWVEQHYRDRLGPDDLADPALIDEVRTALDQLTRILQLGSVYDFQL